MQQYLLIGRKTVDENENWKYDKDWYRQGFVFKDEEAFLFHEDLVCYIAESDYPNEENYYTRKDIVNICDGDVDIATMLFYMLDWQHPETLYDEYCREEKD